MKRLVCEEWISRLTCYVSLLKKWNVPTWTPPSNWLAEVMQTESVTVCPGSSDPSEKIFNMFASENEVHQLLTITIH